MSDENRLYVGNQGSLEHRKYGIPPYEGIRKKRFEILSSSTTHPTLIIDVGCGEGSNTAELLQKIPDASSINYYGIDIDGDALQKAKKNFGRVPLATATFTQADAIDIDFRQLQDQFKDARAFFFADDVLQWLSPDQIKQLLMRMKGMISASIISIWNPMCVGTFNEQYRLDKDLLQRNYNSPTVLLPKVEKFFREFPEEPYIEDIERIYGVQGQKITAFSETSLAAMLKNIGISNYTLKPFYSEFTPNGVGKPDHLDLFVKA